VVARHVLFVVVTLVGEWCVSVWVTVIGLMSPIRFGEEDTARICARIHRGYMRTNVTGLCLRLLRPAPLCSGATFPRLFAYFFYCYLVMFCVSLLPLDNLDRKTRPNGNAGRQFGCRVVGRRGREVAYRDVICREGGCAAGGARSLCQDKRQWRAEEGTNPSPTTVIVSIMTFLVHAGTTRCTVHFPPRHRQNTFRETTVSLRVAPWREAGLSK